MDIPIQASPALRGSMQRVPLHDDAAVLAACSLGDQISCCALATGLVAACASVGTGIGIIACAAAIGGYVGSDCEECVCGEPLRASVCGWVDIINSIAPGTIPVPSFC